MTAHAAPVAAPADCWDAQYTQQAGLRYWPAEALVRFVARHYALTDTRGQLPGAVLEIGCGNGANLWFLCRYWADVCGIDASPAAVALAQHLTAGNAHVIEGSALTLDPYADETFALVVDVTCLQHVSFHDHGAAYHAVRRVLAPGGRFFSYHLGDGTVGYKRLFPDAGPVSLPDERWLRQQLGRAGFVDIEIERIARHYGDSAGCVAQYWAVSAASPR